MRLRDVLAMPELRLRLLHEPPGALDQVVSRPFTTDLLDPGRYLTGGELVFSGLMWRRRAHDSEIFVGALAAGGAVALAAGEVLLDTVPEDVIRACRERELALIAVPAEVSFADIIEHVAAAGAQRAVRRSLTRERQLLAAVADGRSLSELVDQWVRTSGRVCRILTPSGYHVVPGPDPLGEDEVDRISHAYLRADRLPVAIRDADEPGRSLFRVGPVSEHRLATWIVVVDGIWSNWEPGGVEEIEELTAVAALERARRAERAQALRTVVGDVLAVADTDGSPREVSARLSQAGLDPAADVVVLVAGFPGRPDLLDVVRAVLDDATGFFRRAAVVTASDGRAVALLQHEQGVLGDLLRRALVRLSAGVGRMRLTVGMSRPTGVEALSGALEEARYACRMAELRPEAVSVVMGDELTSSVLLLATVPDQVRRSFARQVLGRVLEYDERNDTGLRETLEVFLNCSGSWNRTAELLHVHVNTVRYRIGRVAELTGKDLSTLEDRVDIFLALRSL